MITGTIKNKIDAIWDIFYSGGISNPLTVIEQITYLMFIHDLGKYDEQKAKDFLLLDRPYTSIFKDHEEYRWSNLINLEPNLMKQTIVNGLFPLIKSLNPDKKSAFARYMRNATFKIESEAKLASILEAMNELYTLEKEEEKKEKEQIAEDNGEADKEKKNKSSIGDIKGDIYEYMLGKLSVSGDLGQFRTPRHIIRMMVELLDPKITDWICDPACGTAGFLVEAGKYIRKKAGTSFYGKDNNAHYNTNLFTGYDIDSTMLEIAAMNMMQHNIEDPHIAYKNGLTVPEVKEGIVQEDESEKYTIILANPPFTGTLDKNTIHPDLKNVTATTKTELLFLAQFLKLLKIGGRAAVIVPSGVLFGSSKAHVQIRKELVDGNTLQAVIALPSGIFKPYSGVSTAILIFTKTGHGGTDKVWFYDMKNDGFSLDDKRQPIEENDISDIIARFKNLDKEENRQRTEQSFLVPKDEIVENNYDLSINKYKEIVYEQEELPSSAEIMAELAKLDEEYEKEFAILQDLLKQSNDMLGDK